MPTYDYECQKCQHKFEEFQSITAKPLRKCPACGKPSLKRLIGTGAGIIFKGSGFYQTDYRSDSYKQAAQKDSSGSSSSSSTSTSATASTSETKSSDSAKPAETAKPAASTAAPAAKSKKKQPVG